MKKYIAIIGLLFLILSSCNKEPAIEPNAQFKTKLIDNTAYAGETFYIYLDDTYGEFYALYKGLTPSNTFDPEDPSKTGENIDPDEDSIAITYNNAGEYALTLVATSTGNWGEDIKRDVYTLPLVVKDPRTGFVSLEVGLRIGEITSENEILFYAHKLEDISNERVKYITESGGAEVYVDGVLQETGRNRHDFSAVNPGDDEGRPVVYTVKAPSGDTEDFTVKFILRKPSSEKQLFAVSSSNIEAEFELNEDAKTVVVSYYEGTSLSGKLAGEGSEGAVVKVGNTEIHEKEGNVNLATATEITVVAEDLSEQAYTINLYEKEKITSFNFTAYDDGGTLVNLVPTIEGNVDFASRSISIKVPMNLDLTSLVASFEGISDFTVKIDGTTLVSGVTPYDYSFDPPAEGEDENTSKTFNLEVFDGSTLIDTYSLMVSY